MQRNQRGFALIEFVINFAFIFALMGIIVAITGFISIYARALIMTRAYVVRPILVNGGFYGDVRDNICDTTNPESYVSKMQAQGFTVKQEEGIKIEHKNKESDRAWGELHDPWKVQLRTPLKITVKCEYNLKTNNIDASLLQIKIPITIVSYGKTEFFWHSGSGVDEYRLED